jgi:hypothetical protein
MMVCILRLPCESGSVKILCRLVEHLSDRLCGIGSSRLSKCDFWTIAHFVSIIDANNSNVSLETIGAIRIFERLQHSFELLVRYTGGAFSCRVPLPTNARRRGDVDDAKAVATYMIRAVNHLLPV